MKREVRFHGRVNLNDPDLKEFAKRYDSLEVNAQGHKIGVMKLIERALIGHYDDQKPVLQTVSSTAIESKKENSKMSSQVKQLKTLSF